MAVQGQTAAETPGSWPRGGRVKQRIESRALAEAFEVLGVDGQIPAAPALQRADQAADTCPGGRVVVLVEHALGAAGEASPERGVDIPVQDTASLRRISKAATALVQKAADNRESALAHEHAVVIEPETASYQVEEVADVLGRRFQRILEIRHRY